MQIHCSVHSTFLPRSYLFDTYISFVGGSTHDFPTYLPFWYLEISTFYQATDGNYTFDNLFILFWHSTTIPVLLHSIDSTPFDTDAYIWHSTHSPTFSTTYHWPIPFPWFNFIHSLHSFIRVLPTQIPHHRFHLIICPILYSFHSTRWPPFAICSLPISMFV